MLRRLLFTLMIASTLPPFSAATAQEVTWQDVARAAFIVVGTPEPFRAEFPHLQADNSVLQVLDVKAPRYLKGHGADFPLWVFVSRGEQVALHRPNVFFLGVAHGDGSIPGFLATSGAAKLVTRQSPGLSPVRSRWQPVLHTETLQRRLEYLLAENEHYRKIGAAYRPGPSDPLLALVWEDLQAIARSQGRKNQEQHVAKLLSRGDEIVPLMIYLVEDLAPFPQGELRIAGGTANGLGDRPFRSLPSRMTHAINDLLTAKTGIYMGSLARYGSESVDRNAIDGWHIYLGRLLSRALAEPQP